MANVSSIYLKYIGGFRVSENNFFSYLTKILAKAGSTGDPMATSPVCLYLVLLKLNSTEDMVFFINSTNTSFGMTGCESNLS